MLSHYWTQALRNFWRFRVTTAVNVAGLALALVCMVSTYVFLQSLLRSDVHFPKASRTLVITQELWTLQGERVIPAFPQAAPPTAKYLRADVPQLEAVARALPLGSLAAAAGDRKMDLFVAAVDPQFLRIFDLPFLSGAASSALASGHEVILTETAAKRLFGDGAALGRRIVLQNKVEVTVSAVIGAIPLPSHMGDRATSLLRFEMLAPMDLLKSLPTSAGIGVPVDPDGEQWGQDIFNTYVLLPSDGSFTAADLLAALPAFAERRSTQPMAQFQMRSVFGAVPLEQMSLALLNALFGGRALSLTAAVFLLDLLILVIACVNYANLAVATATTRAREIGMRKVLGATRLQLMGQHLFEAILLGTVALLLVLAGTALAIPPINQALDTALEFPSLAEPKLWLTVVAVLGGISLAGGAYPALVLSRVAPIESLRAGAVRAGPRFVPTILVGVQFAAASFLLIAALLMANQNRLLERNALRADRDPVVVIANDTRQLGIDFQTLRGELLRHPDIRSVSGAGTLPWSSGGWHYPLRRTPDDSTSAYTTLANQISYDFFETLGITVLAGRVFDEQHDDEFFAPAGGVAGRVPNVVVDRSFARQLGWPNPADAVGQLIYDTARMSGSAPARSMRVIGVVENGYPRLVGPNTESNMYLLSPDIARVPLVRISREAIPDALAHIDEVWERLAANTAVRRQFMDELFEQAYQSFSTISRVVAGLAGFAFTIALMGLFGMAIHVTSRRRREIGIRKTLGASATQVVFMLLRDFARPVVVANLVAWPLAYMAGNLYLNLFTEPGTISPWPFVAGLLITLAIAWAAVGGQALLAARLEPAKVLRLE